MTAQPDFTPWPALRLSQYPISKTWSNTFPPQQLARLRYAHIKNAMHSIFLSPAMAPTYAKMRQFAFQQGNFSNANRLDLEFFHNVLTHDYPFFLGHKNRELVADFQTNDKNLQGILHLKASHLDLYRVEKIGFGFAQLQCLLHKGTIHAFFSLTDTPKLGDIVLGRILPIGWLPRSMAYSVVEPWDTVMPDYIDNIVSTFKTQFAAFKEKFPEASEKSFLKIEAYHLYELCQSYELCHRCNNALAPIHDSLNPMTTSLIFTNIGDLPKLQDIPNAQIIPGNDAVCDIATCPTTRENIHETLKNAIISRENRTLEITTFLNNAGNAFILSLVERFQKNTKIIKKIRLLDKNETYRALRHLSFRQS